MPEYYRLSGKVAPVYFLYCLLGVLAVAVTSVVYAIIMNYNPIAYLSFLVTLGYGALIGLYCSFITKRGKLRNPVLWVITVIVFFAVFVYIHLAAYAAVVFREEYPVIDIQWFFFLLTQPGLLFGEVYPYIVEEGVWSLRQMETAVSGIPLLIVWLAEHALVIGAAFNVSKETVLNKPFFEESGEWGEEHTCEHCWELQPKESFAVIRQALENEASGYFRGLSAPSGDSVCKLCYYTNPAEENDKAYLCMKNTEVAKKMKGKKEDRKEKISYIVKNLAVSTRYIHSLTEAAREINEKNTAEEPLAVTE